MAVRTADIALGELALESVQRTTSIREVKHVPGFGAADVVELQGD